MVLNLFHTFDPEYKNAEDNALRLKHHAGSTNSFGSTPRYAVSVGTEDQEIVERSEGGYRTKRKVIPGQTPQAPQKDPG